MSNGRRFRRRWLPEEPLIFIVDAEPDEHGDCAICKALNQRVEEDGSITKLGEPDVDQAVQIMLGDA